MTSEQTIPQNSTEIRKFCGNGQMLRLARNSAAHGKLWVLSRDYCATCKLLVILADRLFHQAYVGFRRFCVESENLPADLHIVLSDILQEAGL